MLKSNSPIQVVDRAFDLLEILAQANTPIRSVDLAEKLGISLKSVNNLLRALYQRGYVSQDKSRSYLLGSQCFYLGSFADHWGDLRKRVQGVIKNLVEQTSFTGFVGVLENDKLLAISTLHPNELGFNPPRQDWWNELHSTACGRVLLAYMDSDERAKFFARTSRKKMTAITEVDQDRLQTICEEIARCGYAEVNGESRDVASSLAIALHDINGKVIAGVAISGKTNEWMKIPLDQKLAYLNDTVRQIELG